MSRTTEDKAVNIEWVPCQQSTCHAVLEKYQALLLLEERTQIHGGGSGREEQRGGSSATTMVVLSTLVAVSGSYVFGSAYSLFGSILTIGAIIGVIMSGRIADYISQRGLGKKANVGLLTAAGMGVVSAQGYQVMPAGIPIFTEIMNALRLAGVNMVRVHGMGGMGKNTLVKEVVMEAMKNKSCDKMVIATVTQNQDIMKAQGQIAYQLGPTFDEESEWGIASRLRDTLQNNMRNALLDCVQIPNSVPAWQESKGGIINSSRDGRCVCPRVHGMGKNTLMKEVAIEVMKNKSCDKMVIATITQNQDIMKAQGQIADQLGPTFDEESEWGIAS
ncbi:hypothetical protein POTOM_045046 [Populus tomentosa]|uniref:NB-ARC domain-containing protein n=1 Tax=Populus tomentosa TaxID=118781 RepID=A0A8X7YSX0_POPTO|nr:hypothetical protein POTOM_045046 [Populus tomentosa]